MTTSVIHTLDGRDNVLLQILQEYLGLTSEGTYRLIEDSARALSGVLLEKGVNYQTLRSALTPLTKKCDIALFFDRLQIPDPWYGFTVFDRVIPALPKGGSLSVLCGDYIGQPGHQNELRQAMLQQLNGFSKVNWVESQQFFVVYVHNLTNTEVSTIISDLKRFDPFVGSADMTFGSRLKRYLSTILTQAHVLHHGIALMAHEDDVSNSEDWNVSGYPFETHGWVVRSLQAELFNLFLSYKIERPPLPGEMDNVHSLNALHPVKVPLQDLETVVSEEKFQYVMREKPHLLAGLGLEGAGRQGLAAAISEKVSRGYFYRLSRWVDGAVGFNVVLERPNPSFRCIASLKYLPGAMQIALVTLSD